MPEPTLRLAAVARLPTGAVGPPHLLAPVQGAGAEDRELNILLSGVFNSGFVAVAEGG
jgi:hypothetical protein